MPVVYQCKWLGDSGWLASWLACSGILSISNGYRSQAVYLARFLPVSVNTSALCVHEMPMSLPPSVFLEFVAAKIDTFDRPRFKLGRAVQMCLPCRHHSHPQGTCRRQRMGPFIHEIFLRGTNT